MPCAASCTPGSTVLFGSRGPAALAAVIHAHVPFPGTCLLKRSTLVRRWVPEQELDVDAEMQRGLLPGAIALSGKFVPAVRGVSQRSVEAVRLFVTDPASFSDRVRAHLWRRWWRPLCASPAASCGVRGLKRAKTALGCHAAGSLPLTPRVAMFQAA